MSIVIREMKMPESCDDCPIQNKEYGECQLTGIDNWEWAKPGDSTCVEVVHPRPMDCPLFEVKAWEEL